MQSALFVVAAVVTLADDAVVVRALPEFDRFVVNPLVIILVGGCCNLLFFAFQHGTGTRSGLMIFYFLAFYHCRAT
jgi:drug/metabolite transporter (DMT)-like permease